MNQVRDEKELLQQEFEAVKSELTAKLDCAVERVSTYINGVQACLLPELPGFFLKSFCKSGSKNCERYINNAEGNLLKSYLNIYQPIQML